MKNLKTDFDKTLVKAQNTLTSKEVERANDDISHNAIQFNLPLPTGFSLRKGKYIIYNKISHGAFGLVYLASDENKKLYAIKEFLPNKFICRTNPKSFQTLSFKNATEKQQFESNLRGFFLEAETILKFNHPNIIKMVDIFEENQTAYIVMPLEKGNSLLYNIVFANKIQKRNLSEREATHILLETSKGLNYLHELGYLHLDLKPANIWQRLDGSIVLLDLGSTRHLSELDKEELPNITQGYAPRELEQFNVSKINFCTDIYSLGAILYFCLTAKKLESAEYRQKNRPAPFSSQWKGMYSATFLNTLDKCLETEPQKRYNSIQEIVHSVFAEHYKIRSERERLKMFTYPASSLTKHS